jgi:hypothetical protein
MYYPYKKLGAGLVIRTRWGLVIRINEKASLSVSDIDIVWAPVPIVTLSFKIKLTQKKN